MSSHYTISFWTSVEQTINFRIKSTISSFILDRTQLMILLCSFSSDSRSYYWAEPSLQFYLSIMDYDRSNSNVELFRSTMIGRISNLLQATNDTFARSRPCFFRTVRRSFLTRNARYIFHNRQAQWIMTCQSSNDNWHGVTSQ